MNQPSLVHTGTKYVFHVDYYQREKAKEARLQWDPSEKIWWTADPAKAALLREYADESLKRELSQVGRKVEETLALSRATDADISIPAPAGFNYLPYQKAGIKFAIERPNILLADQMGLGKTIQAIGLINACPEIKTVLVVCPASLKLNWCREIALWLTRARPVAIVGKRWPHGFDIVIINYDILGKWHDELREKTWDLVVADESHYCKNSDSIRTRQLFGCPARRVRDKATKQMVVREAVLPVPARRAVLLTGTPVMNRPVELWPLIHFLDPATWSNHFAFKKRYCEGKQKYGRWDFSGASHLDELQHKLRSSIMIRRLKEDVLTELPPKRRQVIELPSNGHADLVAQENRAWDTRESRLVGLKAAVEMAKASDKPEDYKDAVAALQEGIGAAFTEIAKLRHDTALAKVPDVIDHIEQCLEAGSGKIICFAHHIDVINALVAAFPGEVVKMDGRDSMPARQAAVDAFQRNPKIKVIVGGLGPMGVGHTLTASAHVVFAEIDWVPAVISQAEARCHRIGQRNNVLIQHLVLEGSLDAKMIRRMVEKQEVIDATLDTPGFAAEHDEPLAPETAQEAPATRGIAAERIAREAAALTPQQIAAVHAALKVIAGVCDGANAMDGHGFSKVDAYIGHEFAHRSSLTPKQAAVGRRVALKYRRQLTEDLTEIIQGAV